MVKKIQNWNENSKLYLVLCCTRFDSRESRRVLLTRSKRLIFHRSPVVFLNFQENLSNKRCYFEPWTLKSQIIRLSMSEFSKRAVLSMYPCSCRLAVTFAMQWIIWRQNSRKTIFSTSIFPFCISVYFVVWIFSLLLFILSLHIVYTEWRHNGLHRQEKSA